MNIALVGYGKMGRTIERLAIHQGHNIVGIIDVENRSNLIEIVSQADVAIEFTHPESAYQNIRDCLSTRTPVVCGTTGWLDRMEKVKKLVEENDTSFLYASNFSIGVNLFFALNEFLVNLMKDHEAYQASIDETHHIHKKDAPSGTAITLAEGIVECHPAYKAWSLSSHLNAGHPEVPIAATREGEVYGRHRVSYRSSIDVISIEHDAFSRDGFALGAIQAAAFIIGQKGVFTMKDVLKIG